jgi:hypothetical protein
MFRLAPVLLFCLVTSANAQVDTDEAGFLPGEFDAELNIDRIPALLSLVEVSEPEVIFYLATGATRVMVKFDTRVQNSGGANAQFLILANVTGGEPLVSSPAHRIGSRTTLDSTEVPKSDSPGSDNWNLDRLRIEAVPKGGSRYFVFDGRGAPLFRFTGSASEHEFPFNP